MPEQTTSLGFAALQSQTPLVPFFFREHLVKYKENNPELADGETCGSKKYYGMAR
jgi:hypothetical protein